LIEKQQDNTLNDTVDYNKPAIVEKPKSKPILESTTTTMISVPTRKEKKKDKRDLKKTTKELLNYLNSPSKGDNIMKAFKSMLGLKYDYERLFVEHECLVYKMELIKLEHRFIRDNEHQYIKCIICSCGKRLVEKKVEKDVMMSCSCGLTYKIIKINNVYWDKTTKMIV
jgi:hypothetical protein